MNFETISAEDFGRSLKGLGLNVLVRDVKKTAHFLNSVFAMNLHRLSDDFAIITYGEQIFQLHADPTYHSNKLPSLLPEHGPRGGGLEIRLYDTDPDAAEKKALEYGDDILVLASCENKPHGLRECIILCQDGYAWIPSSPLASSPQASSPLAANS